MGVGCDRYILVSDSIAGSVWALHFPFSEPAEELEVLLAFGASRRLLCLDQVQRTAQGIHLPELCVLPAALAASWRRMTGLSRTGIMDADRGLNYGDHDTTERADQTGFGCLSEPEEGSPQGGHL